MSCKNLINISITHLSFILVSLIIFCFSNFYFSYNFALAQSFTPVNGISYVLLPKELQNGLSGVYRLNSYTDPTMPLAIGIRLFDLNFSGTKNISGLAVNQQNRLFLFVCPNIEGEYVEVSQEGWIPPGAFAPDSPAYIKLIGEAFSADQVSQDVTSSWPTNRQYTHGTTNYDNDFWDYGPCPATPYYPSGWPYTHGVYKKGNFKDASGNSYNYKFEPYAPNSHKNLPLWNGPGANAAGVKHPTDPYKVILPNKWGGISWFAFGTLNSNHPYQLMDGKDGKPEMTQYDFRLYHDNVSGGYRREVTYNNKKYWIPLMSPYWDALYISAVVKRTYKKRDRSLDLYSYLDDVLPPSAPPYSIYPSLDTSKVLSATDLDITESYGKSCGDGCIPGGELNPQAVGKIEATVQVVTSTTGRRYGFNPFGKTTGPYGENDAALRVVVDNTTYNLDLNNVNINNVEYLNNLGIAVNKITKLGVSSNFSPVSTPITKAPDYLYGSIADLFVIQDSWWGIGGWAYEYFANDVVTSTGKSFQKGHIYRLKYSDTQVPTPEDLGEFSGAIDAIAVDGQGYLYTLCTELDCPNTPAWPDPTGNPVGYDFEAKWPNPDIINHPNFLETGKWMRPGIGTADKEATLPLQPGDYMHIYFKQNVYKVARRYMPKFGGGIDLTSVEERGRVLAGYDVIFRTLEYKGGNTYAWLNGLGWRHAKVVADRIASIKAEFAVVNIAHPPQTFHPPEACQYSICRSDLVSSKQPIYEGSEITFKLEGYKPFINGKTKDFVYRCNIPELGGEVFINAEPPYQNFDEDNDGNAGGFPSSTFETPSIETDVRWIIELLDSNDPNCSDEKVLLRFVDHQPSYDKKYHKFKFKFPQPGNYRVYAKVTYNYFKFEDLQITDRPSDLAKVRKTVGPYTTKKILYQVQSDPNTKAEKYITEIKLENQNYYQNVGNISLTNYGYNLPENDVPNALKFSFIAQFVRDANRNLADKVFETYAGVGVWDYGDPDGHVYNYEGPNTYNMNYNPGWNKPGDPYNRANHGTKVVDMPTTKDKKAIKWRLYIYPTYNDAPSDVFSMSGTGILFAEGDCENAEVTQIGSIEDRKFKFVVSIPTTKLKPIFTPIDPDTYRLRLEIIYPRVKWIEYKTGSNADKPQYRSIVPDDLPIGIVTTVKGSEENVAWNLSNGNDELFVNGDSWYLRVRDTVVEQANLQTDDDPIIQTTGDPVNNVNVKITLSDNNPNVIFPPTAGFKSQIRYQFPKYQRDRGIANKNNLEDRYKEASLYSSPSPKPTSLTFFENDNYRIYATYTAQIDDYKKFDKGEEFQNWIGSLEFSAEAQIQDGYGKDWPLNTTTPHVFTHNAKPEEFPQKIQTKKVGLQRYDNDPPSLFITIISQLDNRRWEFQLIENIHDLEQNPKSIEKLGKCKLNIACYTLQDNKLINSVSLDVPGSSNNPHLLNQHEIIKLTESADGLGTLLNSEVISCLPVIRRSGRIQINFNFTDNVDYLNFKSASLDIKEKNGTSLLATPIPPISLENAFIEGNNIPNSAYVGDNMPKGRFFADMPLKVLENQSVPSNYQVILECKAEDSSGNLRGLIIPIKIADVTFETRIIESEESRK